MPVCTEARVEMFAREPGVTVGVEEGVGVGAMVGVARAVDVAVGDGVSTTVVVRAIGPSLAAIPVDNPLQNPTLELVDSDGMQIRFDDDWRDTQEMEIEDAGFAPPDDRESAIEAVLAPGLYTAIVRGKSNTSGVGLMEVYNVLP